jgi:Peptidase A4 family
VSAQGVASYSAWWELVPVPAVTISGMKIERGDRMFASVAEAGIGLWTVTLRDITRHERFSTTVPYPSSQASAEWIEETPVEIGSGGAGLASLPKLHATPFAHATVNGAPAALSPSQEVQLYSGSTLIGLPSAPDAARTAFSACAWVRHCRAP